jgi:hypothetical protein
LIESTCLTSAGSLASLAAVQRRQWHAAPPMSVMNSRRLMVPRRPWDHGPGRSDDSTMEPRPASQHLPAVQRSKRLLGRGVITSGVLAVVGENRGALRLSEDPRGRRRTVRLPADLDALHGCLTGAEGGSKPWRRSAGAVVSRPGPRPELAPDWAVLAWSRRDTHHGQTVTSRSGDAPPVIFFIAMCGET